MMRNIFSKIKKTSKKTFTLIMAPIVSVAILGLITNAVAGANVLMEGHTKALNVTKGETTYRDNTSALVDDVVQVQLWHHNREMPTGEKANNVRVKFNVPTATGKSQTITGTTSADNANTVTDTTQVDLSLDRARIEYVPGTAKFRYNKGAQDGDTSCQTGIDFPPDRCYSTVQISDSVVGQGVNLDSVRGGPLVGCNAYHETVTIQVRVKADVVSVNKYVRHKGQGADAWKVEGSAKPGDRLEYLIRFKNEGNTTLEDVAVGDNLPRYHTYVDNTTMLQNGAFPNGTKITSNNITRGGIDVGNYAPGAVGYVWFETVLDPVEGYENCGGDYDLRNVGVVKPSGMEQVYNTTILKVRVDCGEVISNFNCDGLSAVELSENNFRFTASGSTQNATITSYTFRLNGNVVQNTANNVYNFSSTTPGNYTVSVVINTDKGVTPQSEVCTRTVNVEQVQEQAAACDLLSLTKLGGRKVRLAVNASTSGGATIQRYIYNFGDGNTQTSDNSVVEHEYANDGNYVASVQVIAIVNGVEQSLTSANCSAPVKFEAGQPVCVDNPNTSVNECAPSQQQQIKTAVTRLPDTGMGAVAAIFAGVTSLSSLAYYAVIRRF